jgi:hypothetical protein
LHLPTGSDRSIDARSIVTLIAFFIISQYSFSSILRSELIELLRYLGNMANPNSSAQVCYSTGRSFLVSAVHE